MRILLTDGDQRSTLAAVRALGSAGIEVHVGESSRNSLASRSRHCASSFVYPSPYDDEAGFVQAVVRTAVQQDVALIMPMTDISSAILAEHRHEFAPTLRVAVPDAETFWRASDKNTLHALAERLGVPTPTTHYIDAVADPGELSDVEYPCIVKPTRSRVRAHSGWTKTSVQRVESRAELERALQVCRELQCPSMIQRVVDGDGIGVFALCEHGEPCMLFAHRRLREKPPSGGVSVLREAVPLDPVATEYASRLLRGLKWHGVAMVEFKRDRVTHQPYLMEINARFWGSLQLAIDAGLNFPLQAVRLWLGEPVMRQTTYQVGIRSRWLLGDLDHLLLRLSSNGAPPPDAPSIPTLLVDFCRFFRADTRFEIESWRDPGPSLHEIGLYARDVFRSFARAGR